MRLGGAVLGGQQHVGGVGVGDAGVGEQADAGRLGGLDDVAVLRDPLADLAAGDEQDPVRAREAPRRGTAASS